ncbi:hypothetical protein BJV78DRAFT_1284371 [Lactifluus subvellereus]|nr:hypothetical protein BJV78DRAFT_1284371 [Lactifluus subvellereus]
MYPPGIGNDRLVVGNIYVISIYGTDNVFTADGDDLHDNNRFSFTNVGTGKYLGRDVYQNLACYATSQDTWECLTLRALPEGGYRLSADINSRICPTLLASDSGGNYMRVVADSSTIVGLHQYNAPPPFRRFEWVITESGWLARASAPNYDDTATADPDSTQNMDDNAVQFLVANGITNVISMNTYELSATEKQRLTDNNISYTHLSVVDFQAPTLDDLDQAQQAYTSHISGRTLVYCGYGHGRTGTVITALQLYMGRDRTHADYYANHVEDPSQFAVLDQLRTNLGFQN